MTLRRISGLLDFSVCFPCNQWNIWQILRIRLIWLIGELHLNFRLSQVTFDVFVNRDIDRRTWRLLLWAWKQYNTGCHVLAAINDVAVVALCWNCCANWATRTVQKGSYKPFVCQRVQHWHERLVVEPEGKWLRSLFCLVNVSVRLFCYGSGSVSS